MHPPHKSLHHRYETPENPRTNGITSTCGDSSSRRASAAVSVHPESTNHRPSVSKNAVRQLDAWQRLAGDELATVSRARPEPGGSREPLECRSSPRVAAPADGHGDGDGDGDGPCLRFASPPRPFLCL